jgi:putative transposase
VRFKAMPRPLRTAPGGFVYHVLNRANGKRRIFEHDRDYLAFERVLGEVQERIPMRILAWCVMPNHWHLLLWPREDGDLSRYMRLVTLTHTQRRHAYCASAGTGHLYQGRFKSFVVQSDTHLLTVARYVEANALSAKLVQRAEDWRWGSLWRVVHAKRDQRPHIHPWPVTRPSDWLMHVNQPTDVLEVDAVRRCAQRGRPYGSETWVETVAEQLGLECTLRPRGRPPNEEKGSLALFPEKGS